MTEGQSKPFGRCAVQHATVANLSNWTTLLLSDRVALGGFKQRRGGFRQRMNLVIFIGIQGTGKSTFFRERFHDTHIRINLDMLRTRHRESILYAACLQAKQPVVVDNTNPTVLDREKYIKPAKQAGFRIIGYYFNSAIKDALARNATRGDKAITERGVRATHNKLEQPRMSQGFDELHYVSIARAGEFVVREWQE